MSPIGFTQRYRLKLGTENERVIPEEIFKANAQNEEFPEKIKLVSPLLNFYPVKSELYSKHHFCIL